MSESWTIGILCYNEENSIDKVVQEVVAVLNTISPHNSEIIIVNDGSADNTISVINNLKEKYDNIIIINHNENLGIGQAILSVHEKASKENLCVISGDGESDVTELMPYAILPENSFISFYRKENTVYNFQRNILSYFNQLFNKLFLGIYLKDVNWTKIYKTKDIQKLNLKLTSSLVESEICFKLINNGVRAIETPSKYLPRITGESTGASWNILSKVLLEIVKLIIESIKFRFFK